MDEFITKAIEVQELAPKIRIAGLVLHAVALLTAIALLWVVRLG